mmetsp:Transcript_8349/g.7414  ORF Transcript_8349/g.7414 Transcript_8349/m.7414 type:complete len:103 (+) Transcript_8349:48-356(+)
MYFELDDINRRHTFYYSTYGAFSYSPTPDNYLGWNWQRGAIAGTLASLATETSQLFSASWELMLSKYEWPKNFSQYKIFFRETMRLDSFRYNLKNKVQYSIA